MEKQASFYSLHEKWRREKNRAASAEWKNTRLGRFVAQPLEREREALDSDRCPVWHYKKLTSTVFLFKDTLCGAATRNKWRTFVVVFFLFFLESRARMCVNQMCTFVHLTLSHKNGKWENCVCIHMQWEGVKNTQEKVAFYYPTLFWNARK